MAPDVTDFQDWASRKTGAVDPASTGPGGSEPLEPITEEGVAGEDQEPADAMYDAAGILNEQADRLEKLTEKIDDATVITAVVENLRTQAGDLESAADDLSGVEGEEEGDEEIEGDVEVPEGDEAI